MIVFPAKPLVSKTITLNNYSLGNLNPAGNITSLDGKENPLLRMSESFVYECGSLAFSITEEYHDIGLNDN